MKIVLFFLLISVSVISCNNDKKVASASEEEAKEKQDFFPVTSYLKGQINELKTSGINPMKVVSINGKSDTSWLKVEEFDSVFVDFLNPEIDSINMVQWFKEDKFHDKTLNAYTFTYEPKADLPAAMQLRRWDVYVNPENNKVQRVYLQKNISDKKMLQLSWESNLGSKAVYISSDASGTAKVEKEVFIKWNFDRE